MSEKIYYVIKLAPHVSSWCDLENNIYLSVPNKTSKRLKEGCDMKMINKGVKAGLIILKECCDKVEPKVVEIPKAVERDVEISVDVTPEPVTISEPEQPIILPEEIVEEEVVEKKVSRKKKTIKEEE